MYTKTCVICKDSYEASGPAGKYCPICAEDIQRVNREKARLRAESRRRASGCRIGRGQLPGVEHPNYRHGLYVSQTQNKKYKELAGHECERCGKDLASASRHQWVMHHKDHNHANHSLDNLELLCKRCHQLEHSCQDNLKVQRLSR